MARKKKAGAGKRTRIRVDRNVPRVTVTVPTRTKRPLRKVVNTTDLSKRPPLAATVRAREVKRIKRKEVTPSFSLISPLNCDKKKRDARRTYFGYRAKGRPSKGGNSNRFTVRCP